MAQYRELAPPPHLTESVECLWILQPQASSRSRVLPDGCADIIFIREPARASLLAVGAMTSFADVTITSSQALVGVRFRPGMWAEYFGIPSPEITDTVLPLEDIWGARGQALLARIADAKSVNECAQRLGEALRPPVLRTPMQRALAWMEANPGCISLDEMAWQAGMSARQFRRVCRQQTGLSPKFLARVLRFRKALAKLQTQAGDHAGLAADCGYFDQSHFIAEFQRFAGQTPAAYRSFSH